MSMSSRMARLLVSRILVSTLLLSSAAWAAASPVDDAWEHKRWIAKAGRALSAGVPLTNAEVEALAPYSREEVVERLMQRPDFGDAVFDFNLFYLGFKPEFLWRSKGGDPNLRSYDDMVFAKPQAIAAARSVLADGDFFDILNLEVPRFMSPVGHPYGDDPTQTDEETRATLLADALAAFDTVYGWFTTKEAGCEQLQSNPPEGERIGRAIYDAGYSFNETIDVLQYPTIELNIHCSDPTRTREDILAELAEFREAVVQLHAQTPRFVEAAYPIRSFADIQALSGENLPRWLRSSQFGFFGYWLHLPNSSTNYNRKRGAYALKTFFCDDLTPLGVVSDGGHAGDRHADEPGCQSCHYKLDPMAGFYKDFGVSGVNFKDSPFLVFDDQAVIFGEALDKYRNAWPEMGYVRSLRDRRQNDYGTSLEDLYGRILRRAPEVKQCLTRRLAEYYLGKDQVFDGGWLAHLTDTMAAAPTSGKGYKEVVKKLLMSRTFSERDPAADQCYDYYPAEPGADALPCAVAHVVRNNCALCHRSTSPSNGGLDLTHWVDGTFPHLDEDGRQLPKATTFARLAERLSTADPIRSMPLNKDMNAVEKARLFQWVVRQTR